MCPRLRQLGMPTAATAPACRDGEASPTEKSMFDRDVTRVTLDFTRRVPGIWLGRGNHAWTAVTIELAREMYATASKLRILCGRNGK